MCRAIRQGEGSPTSALLKRALRRVRRWARDVGAEQAIGLDETAVFTWLDVLLFEKSVCAFTSDWEMLFASCRYRRMSFTTLTTPA